MGSYQQDREPVCLSPQSTGGFDEEPEPRTKSPHHVEMYTFRDAIDVNYQRMALTGEELSGMPLEDLKEAAKELIEALILREEYMELIGNQFPTTTKHFLSGYYPQNLPKCRRKNTEMSKRFIVLRKTILPIRLGQQESVHFYKVSLTIFLYAVESMVMT
ncbi:unnamed protein product [Toxocara canis]|uniref:AMP deaminase 2 n=1 Tax=Toxocara canis TaxID=6265 RepID=A0A183VFU2_TOXCA|nr:unnamed protein product [Toxocara canis]